MDKGEGNRESNKWEFNLANLGKGGHNKQAVGNRTIQKKAYV